MFKIDSSPAYWWPVVVHVAKAGDVAGEVVEQRFEVEFKRFTESEIDQLTRDLARTNGGDVDMARRVMRSFRGVEQDGASFPPTPENTAALLDIAGVANAVCRAFFESRRPSREDPAQKN